MNWRHKVKRARSCRVMWLKLPSSGFWATFQTVSEEAFSELRLYGVLLSSYVKPRINPPGQPSLRDCFTLARKHLYLEALVRTVYL
jgi:hypothetical protein